MNPGIPRDRCDQLLVESELALDQSTNAQDVTSISYLAPVNSLDVSNSNTHGVIDPTNPVLGANYG